MYNFSITRTNLGSDGRLFSVIQSNLVIDNLKIVGNYKQ